MQINFIFGLLVGNAVLAAPEPTASPIQVYLKKKAGVFKRYTLKEEDDLKLKKKVKEPAYFESLLNGKVTFDTGFLDNYSAKPSLIVLNYVERMKLDFLRDVHDIIDFFYKANEKFENFGVRLFAKHADDNEVTKDLGLILGVWIQHSPAGQMNIKLMLTHLKDGPLNQELIPFLKKVSAHIRKYYLVHLTRINKVIDMAHFNLHIFPDDMYTLMKKLFLPN